MLLLRCSLLGLLVPSLVVAHLYSQTATPDSATATFRANVRIVSVEATGLSFAMEIDVPPSNVYLRSGVYDLGSSKAGTLEIPMAALVAQARAH